MNVHKNARMTVHGRLLLVVRVCKQGWRVEDAALAGGVSVRTAYKWLARHRAGGVPTSMTAARRPTDRPTGCRPRSWPRSSVCAASG